MDYQLCLKGGAGSQIPATEEQEAVLRVQRGASQHSSHCESTEMFL